MSQALTDFRMAYSAMLIAAERVRAEVDPTFTAKVPHDIRSVQAIVACHFGIPLPRLLSRAKDQETVRARHVAMAICHEITKHGRTAIGDAFSRDEGAVAYGIRGIESLCDLDEKFRVEFEILRNASLEEIRK